MRLIIHVTITITIKCVTGIVRGADVGCEVEVRGRVMRNGMYVQIKCIHTRRNLSNIHDTVSANTRSPTRRAIYTRREADVCTIGCLYQCVCINRCMYCINIMYVSIDNDVCTVCINR